ncbi:MAG: tetratricopeptide repeat protein [Gammaproteobacteria bacterium]
MFRSPFSLALIALCLMPFPVLAAQQSSVVTAADQTLMNGDCRGAVQGYLTAGLSERDPRVIERALQVARACRNLPAASKAADRLLELDSENVFALRLVGLVALETWQLDLARKVYGALLAKPDVEPDRALADLLPEFAEGDATHAAWLVWRDIIDRDTVSGETLAAFARIACNADDLKACLSLIETARKKGAGNDARTLRMASAALAALGQGEAALAEADLLVQGDPENYRFARVETLTALDRLNDARDALLAIERESTPGNERIAAEADRRLALLALATGDDPEAERRFAARLSADRNSGESLYYLALLAERRALPDLALQGYRQLISAGAGLPPRIRAAHLLLARGDREEAMAILDQATRGGRVDAIELEIVRSRALFDAGLADVALEALDKALGRFPDHPQLVYQRAVLLDAANRTNEAIKVFEALLKVRPGDGNIQNALGYTLADRKRQLARAETLIREAIAQRPDSAAVVDSLGWVRFRRGDKAGAITELERAWRLSREAEIGAHLGEVLWAAGNQAKAREVWARSLVIAPDSKPLRATIERLTGEASSSGSR